MPRVVHFEFQAGDPDRAAKFYEECFDWKFTKWDGPMPYWLITTGDGSPGIDGGMLQKQGHDDAIVNLVIGVDDVDAYAAKVIAAGGEQVVPKMAIPGVGWVAYFKDTERNIFGVHQHDPSAA